MATAGVLRCPALIRGSPLRRNNNVHSRGFSWVPFPHASASAGPQRPPGALGKETSALRHRQPALRSARRSASCPGRGRVQGRTQLGAEVAEKESDPTPEEGGEKWDVSADCANAYAVLLGVLAVGALPAVEEFHFAYILYFTSLATTTIYIGAHRALSTKQEQIGLKQGLLAPLLTSAALLAVYLVITYLPDLDLKTLLGWYFWLLGSIAIFGNLRLPLNRWGGDLGMEPLHLNLPTWLGVVDARTNETLTEVDVSFLDGVALVLGLVLATADLQAGHANFGLNNLIATCIAVDVLQLVGLNSFKTAAALSAGLLLYDVFWVFGSSSVVGENVMMTVATSEAFTGPFRLVYPRWETVVQLDAGGQFPFSLLGLGDVVVPGLLICLMLKLDGLVNQDEKWKVAAGKAFSATFAGAKEEDYSSGKVALDAADAADAAYDMEADKVTVGRYESLEDLGDRSYLFSTLGAYVFGLAIAFGANYITGAGQPALLYLVPCTIAAAMVVAVNRGELSRLISFEDKTQRDSFVDL